MEEHTDTDAPFSPTYPAAFFSSRSSPSAMPHVRAAVQGPLPNEGSIQPGALAAYPTRHPGNIWWDGATSLDNRDINFGVMSVHLDPSAEQSTSGGFVNSYMPNQDRVIINASNNMPVSGNDGPVRSTASASGLQRGVPARPVRNRFECEDCHKKFDRISRLDNCRNRHLGIKPWQCGGRCYDPSCDAKYACIDYLRRHLLSDEERCAQCPKCHHNISKQNMVRHRESCV